MPERLYMREYKKQAFSVSRVHDLREGAAQLASQLSPTIDQFRTDGQSASFGNVVGSFSLPGGDVVQVSPKVAATDWTSAVIQLLSESTRLAVTGSQHSRPSERKDDLTAALAIEYARRLEGALRKVGPMMVYQRVEEVSRRWRGRLDVTAWARSSVLDPTRFPMRRDELSVANDFTRGLSVVAGLLGRSAAGSEVASRLRRLQNAIIPGQPVPAHVNPAVAHRRLPTQWSAFGPAWDIAAPILKSRSIVGDPGRATGLEVAVEPWRLLETFLDRSLESLVAQEADIAIGEKKPYPLLGEIDGNTGEWDKSFPRFVKPDGLLTALNGNVVASFEAKYASRPKREHVYQALATAAALRSPIAVLIYPWFEPSRSFDVEGFAGSPRRLSTIGVGLFGYSRGTSEVELASKIDSILPDRLGD